MLNQHAFELFESFSLSAPSHRCQIRTVGGATVLDAGVETAGSIAAGLHLARLCLAGHADVAIVPSDADHLVTGNAIYVRTDQPVVACLGGQYAGWPVQSDDFFAMGSGPMRMLRGREKMLEELGLQESGDRVVGVLESDKMVTESAVNQIAADCNVPPRGVSLAIAPSTSIAGSIQVVARSIETALHKLHELEFDVASVVSATGLAPLPPPAKTGDTVGGIGRTNDAILYGATVTLWVDADDESIQHVADRVPSSSSSDHGRPFAEIFKDYQYDFYKVDPMLFSPAVVTMHSLRSGRTWSAGRIETDVLRRSLIA